MITKINVTKSTLILILALFFLVSCSKSHEKYIGYWKLESTYTIVIMEITKNNNIYMLNEDIFRNENKSYALDEAGDELSVNYGFASVNLKLANDSTLLIADKKYIKISQAEVDKIKADIKQKADNWKACLNLRDKYYDEIKKYPSAFNQEHFAKRDEIKAKYKELVKTIPDCEL